MTTRKQIAHGFREAKQHLATSTSDESDNISKSLHICFSLTRAKERGSITIDTMYACKAIVLARLGIYAYFDEWIIERGRVGRRAVNLDIQSNQSRKLQATRHAWLDSLIQEFSK